MYAGKVPGDTWGTIKAANVTAIGFIVLKYADDAVTTVKVMFAFPEVIEGVREVETFWDPVGIVRVGLANTIADTIVHEALTTMSESAGSAVFSVKVYERPP